MPVLYGVFLYMGVSSLKGIQVRFGVCPFVLLQLHRCVSVSLISRPSVPFSAPLQLFDRIKLFGMPAKHQPDLIYLRYVPLWKVHVFTVVQLSCLIVLWAIKASAAAVIFPMMVRQAKTKQHVLYY